MNAAIQSVFHGSDYTLKSIEMTDVFKEATLRDRARDHLFEIHSAEGSALGYAYLGQAPSMKNVFDYLVIMQTDLQIKKAKVLIYREDYGRQIGSQRWLKQFIGARYGDVINYGEEIDAISGATISAKSMTQAVKRVLETMTQLKTEKII